MSDIARYVGGAVGAGALGLVTAGAAAYLASRPTPMPMIVDLNNQSKDVAGEPGARMSALVDGDEPLGYIYDDTRTIYEAVLRGQRISENAEFLGRKDDATNSYKWLKYSEVLEKAQKIGSGLVKRGLKPENSTHVGIYSQNRVEYTVFELGCYAYSMVIVPLYDTLGPDACTFIINQAKISTVLCDSDAKLTQLLDHLDQTNGLQTVVCVVEPGKELRKRAESAGIEIISFQDLELLGSDNLLPVNPAKPEDLCCICYTSGTTGRAKGAMITHANLIASVTGCLVNLRNMNFIPGETMISYLPLAHMYERMVEVVVYCVGGRVGFFGGDIRKIIDDIKCLKPTIFPTVPRLLNRLYDQVMEQVQASLVKRLLFAVALKCKESEIRNRVVRNTSLWDKLVFQKVQATLGGRVRLITTGSAPLSEKILTFMRCAAGCAVVEGYGQTESAAIGTLSFAGYAGTGNVGPPLTCNMMKLVDVPDMDYYAKDNQGEICVKGANVFRGYLDDEEKTREALDEDGWLHSGDIGQWEPDGTLKIIDRKKNIFKLAQGEYIAPEKIEQIYMRSQPVSQIFVHGESLQSFLVAIVVPDQKGLTKWAERKLGVSAPFNELCNDPDVKKAVMNDMVDIGKKAGLKSFEQVKDIYIHQDMFTIENGLLTPTLKSKRNDLQKHFQAYIKAMYGKASL